MKTSFKHLGGNQYRLFVHLENGTTFGLDAQGDGEPPSEFIINAFNHPEYRQRFILEVQELNDYLSDLPYYHFDIIPTV